MLCFSERKCLYAVCSGHLIEFAESGKNCLPYYCFLVLSVSLVMHVYLPTFPRFFLFCSIFYTIHSCIYFLYVSLFLYFDFSVSSVQLSDNATIIVS